MTSLGEGGKSGTATVRWRLDIAYDGAGFSGWAAQPGLRTVQGELEHWLARVLRLADPVSLVCAGRTDSGVHARGQVAHVDLPADAVADSGDALLRRLGRVLPGDVVVRRLMPAPAGFHARFGAVWRRYRYRLWDSPVPPDPLHRGSLAVVRAPLDLAAVNAAGAGLLGLRDFAAFCRRRDGATTIRTLLELHAERRAAGVLAGAVEVHVRADAFCHAMVRSLVGGLVEVGSGRRDAGWLAGIAAAAVRDPALPVMPAGGLVLKEVGYPPDAELAERVAQARTVRTLP